MLTLSSLITIVDPTGNLSIDIPVINLEIDKSRKTLTNTAKIEMPRNIMVKKVGKKTGYNLVDANINDVIQRGASVTIQIGYDGNLVTEFTGFVAQVTADIPLIIKCQDAMWTLKQNSFTNSWGKIKVAEIIKYIYTGTAQVVDLEIGGLRVVKQSTAQILEGLKKFGLQCYFDNGTLIVDFAGAIHNTGNEVGYVFYQNIINTNLEYKLKEDSRIKVIAVSKLQNGKKYQLVAGDNDGEIHTLHYFNMDQDQLQIIVNADIDKLKYEGYKGDFKTFGIPLANPGDKANLHDPIYPEHDGVYLIEAVKTTFGVGGFRREVSLERKLS